MTEPGRGARVLVGAIGYRYLQDHSAALVAYDRLCAMEWPPGVSVEDLSYSPIALLPRLEEGRFDRAVLVGAVAREGRAPGTVTAYRWDGRLPPPETIQAAVVEAVTGVIALDNTLLVAGHFRGLPAETVVVEIAPATEAFGEVLTPPVAAAVDEACARVRALAIEASLAATPLGRLGGFPPEAAAS